MASPATDKPTKRDPQPQGALPKARQSTLSTPQCARARELLDAGDIRATRAECKRVLADGAAPDEAKMEAQDILDATRIDAGPLAIGVAAIIILGFLFMYLAIVSGGAGGH